MEEETEVVSLTLEEKDSYLDDIKIEMDYNTTFEKLKTELEFTDELAEDMTGKGKLTNLKLIKYIIKKNPEKTSQCLNELFFFLAHFKIFKSRNLKIKMEIFSILNDPTFK